MNIQGKSGKKLPVRPRVDFFFMQRKENNKKNRKMMNFQGKRRKIYRFVPMACEKKKKRKRY